MMNSVILASLLAGAAAFAPVSQKATSSALSMAFENELGAQPPLGFYDPLGLVADGDQTKFNRLRYVELKHGRISMLAVAGYLWVEAGGRLPGNIDLAGTPFTDIPNGFAGLSAMPQSGVIQIIAFIGFLEAAVMKELVKGEFPGDFRNGALDFGWYVRSFRCSSVKHHVVDFSFFAVSHHSSFSTNRDTFDAKTKLAKRATELNNGRAAQMGILALMVHEQLGVSIIPGP